MSRPAASVTVSIVDVESMRRAGGADLAPSFYAYPCADGGHELSCQARDRAAEILREARERLERAGFAVMQTWTRLFVQNKDQALKPLPSFGDGPWSPGYYEPRPVAASGRRAA